MSHPDDGVLQELLDGELAPADEATVRAHLAGCASCTTALAELQAMQAEADTIVARLDLDPPLPARQARPVRRARPDLRLLGLAASAVLVAGTSWLLFRSPEAAMRPGKADTASGINLPLPAPEREEAVATRSAEPLAPGARAAVSADRRDRAKQATGDMGAVAGTPAAKKEAAAEADRLVQAPQANAARPAIAMAPPAAAARLAADGPTPAYTTVADAEARLGDRVRTIAGLTPVSVEVLPITADSLVAVRQRYLVSGVTVVLLQQRSPAGARDEVTSKAREPAFYVDGSQVQPGSRGNGFSGAAESAGVQPVSRSWEAWGSLFQLRGALPADSLDALVKRVR